jgi:hypothetical protein
MALQNAKNPPSVALVTVEIPVGVAWRIFPEALIPEPGFDELSLVPSLAVNDQDRTLLAVRMQLSQDVVMKPVIAPSAGISPKL